MPHVLLIDDDASLLKALRSTLEQAAPAVTVDMASTVEQALQVIQHVEHDAIISDFCMPGLNGIDFLIKCKAVRADIPIILLTGSGSCELEKEALKEGAYAVFQKPVNGGALMSAVTSAVIRREVRRAARAEGNSFSATGQRLSSRLKEIDERLKKQIDGSEKGTES